MLTFRPRPLTLLLHLKSVFIANPEESCGDVPQSRSPLFPFPRCVCLRSNCGTNRNSLTSGAEECVAESCFHFSAPKVQRRRSFILSPLPPLVFIVALVAAERQRRRRGLAVFTLPDVCLEASNRRRAHSKTPVQRGGKLRTGGGSRHPQKKNKKPGSL